MRFLLKLLKGALIGIAVVIPGVSGGSMAMSMGIYTQIIEFFSAGKGAFKHGRVLLPYGVGVLIGVGIFSYFIELMFQSFPLQTACLFVGMIAGALPMLLKKVKGAPFRPTHLLLMLGTAALIVLLTVVSQNSGGASMLQPTAPHAVLALGLGFVSAATMTVPGLSGSMLLILLGYFEPLLQYVNGFTAALFRLDFPTLLERAVILVPFTLGVVIGIICMARLVRVLLKRYPLSTYYGIIGLVLASPFTVFYQQRFMEADPVTMILGVLFIAAGFLLAVLLGGGKDDR
ncbi:MAG TPA: DUF368 domain-containing protein [Feifaniaceae bacterium]|nr:DUF368 domain-containing protein [Feifaniaceae bacterium]